MEAEERRRFVLIFDNLKNKGMALPVQCGPLNGSDTTESLALCCCRVVLITDIYSPFICLKMTMIKLSLSFLRVCIRIHTFMRTAIAIYLCSYLRHVQENMINSQPIKLSYFSTE